MTDFALEGPRWAWSPITWSFAPAGGVFTGAIAGAYQDIVRAAIARWSGVADVSFKEVADDAAVDIRVGWGVFTGTELGETEFSSLNDSFLPGMTVRLEDPAFRAVGTLIGNAYRGTETTLFQTALHEFGHALGLGHSADPADIMYPVLGPETTDLGSADIQGLQLLYGAPLVAVYRFFDSTNGTQFLTASAAERDSVIATRLDLTYEGVGLGGIAPGADPAAIPVYRFFDTATGTHFFTSSASEQQDLVRTRPDLVLEPTSFYEHATAQAGDDPVYRFFDRNDGTHFYTSSTSERAAIAATRADMIDEGIAFYAPAAASK